MKYQNIAGGKTECLICPRKCKLKEGQRGFCHTRQNIGGNIVLTTYGFNTGLSLDPVEKKPLYHFYPGTSILSFGTVGCIMGCRFCQNYHTSKSTQNPKTLNKTLPKEIVKIAKENGIKSIAFTYNDPVAFFEYALFTAKLAKKEGIKTAAITSGYINIEPLKELFQFIDAANVDLKGFSEKFYAKNCLAKLSPVLDAIKYIKNETKCHLELTTLLIEGENDSENVLKDEFNWILENTGDETPLHLSAFTPLYKFKDRPKTKFETLFSAYNLAKNMGLKNVYTGNLSTIETSSTYCKKCGKPLIVRSGYKILKNNIEKGMCIFCKSSVYGEF